jgi:hypothetical protein
MSVTLTTQTANGVTVIVGEQTGGTGAAIAINYATLYGRMADALENLAANVASIKTTLENMSANVSVIRTNSTTMATLASGNGMHIVSPYESFGAVSLYRLYAEEGAILDTKNYVNDEKETEANNAIAAMMTKVEPFRQF